MLNLRRLERLLSGLYPLQWSLSRFPFHARLSGTYREAAGFVVGSSSPHPNRPVQLQAVQPRAVRPRAVRPQIRCRYDTFQKKQTDAEGRRETETPPARNLLHEERCKEGVCVVSGLQPQRCSICYAFNVRRSTTRRRPDPLGLVETPSEVDDKCDGVQPCADAMPVPLATLLRSWPRRPASSSDSKRHSIWFSPVRGTENVCSAYFNLEKC